MKKEVIHLFLLTFSVVSGFVIVVIVIVTFCCSFVCYETWKLC